MSAKAPTTVTLASIYELQGRKNEASVTVVGALALIYSPLETRSAIRLPISSVEHRFFAPKDAMSGVR